MTTPINLTKKHEDLLYVVSAIGQQEVARRGYRTEINAQELKALGYPADPAYVPALVIPIFDVFGRNGVYQIRPDNPPPDPKKPGKVKKYIWPAGVRMVIDCHPDARLLLSDPKTTLYVAEGVRKGDAAVTQGLCCVALIGVTAWRGKNALSGIVALPDWNEIALNGRKVRLAFDSDCLSNLRVRWELLKLGDYLSSRGAEVEVIVFSPGQNGAKVGFDDWLASGHKLSELDALARPLAAVAAYVRTTIRNAATQDYLDALTYLGYTFRLNECTDMIEVNGADLTDGLAATIRNQMRDLGLTAKERVEDTYMADAWEQRYHPIRAYLDGLVWDGKPHIETLAARFEDEHPPVLDHLGEEVSVFRLYLRRWMIGAVAKVMAGEQNTMLVLDGPQGIGKSFFARWLCSGLPGYFIEGTLNPDDKDSLVRLVSYWIWEVSELGATTRKTDVQALKNFISEQRVVVRRAYGRFDLRKPAQASLIGTVNNDGGFLFDTTGNRRFMALTLTSIDRSYTKLDVNQLWAEAVVAYQNGEPWQLAGGERAVQSELNKAYEVDDPLADMLLHACTLDAGAFTPTAQLIGLLQRKGYRTPSSRALAMEIARAAKKLGLRKDNPTINGTRLNGYWGIREDDPLFQTP